MTALESAGIADVVVSSDKRRYLKTDRVECDLYRLLAGDEKQNENTTENIYRNMNGRKKKMPSSIG